MNRKKLLVAFIFFLVVSTPIGWVYRNIFLVEEKPFEMLGAAARLHTTKSKIIKLSEYPEIYILKNNDKGIPLIDQMKSEGYNFVDGSRESLFFTGPHHSAIGEIRNFAKYYSVIKVTRIFEEPEGDEHIENHLTSE